MLLIKHFQSEDLNREINCSAQNQRGSDTRRAELREEGIHCRTPTSCPSVVMSVVMFTAAVTTVSFDVTVS